MSDNYADEFDVDGFIVMSEEDYLKARNRAERHLDKFFAVPDHILSGSLTAKEFEDNYRYSYKTYFDPVLQQNKRVTYEDYANNPALVGPHLHDKEYEIYFGTNEQLMFSSKEHYFQGLDVSEITEEEYQIFNKYFKSYTGNPSFGFTYFPIDDWVDDEEN